MEENFHTPLLTYWPIFSVATLSFHCPFALASKITVWNDAWKKKGSSRRFAYKRTFKVSTRHLPYNGCVADVLRATFPIKKLQKGPCASLRTRAHTSAENCFSFQHARSPLSPDVHTVNNVAKQPCTFSNPRVLLSLLCPVLLAFNKITLLF